MSIIKLKCPACSKLIEYLIPEKLLRTKQQNKYYWVAVVGIPAKDIGYSNEEMHEAYKIMFLRMHKEGCPETVRSTTDLNTKEFTEYVEKCRMWAAENGYEIPDPEESILA
jgi:hypothetical protein